MARFETAVVGGGLAGFIAALAMGRAGRSVALIAPETEKTDRRTTALMDQSVRFMERLGLWDRVSPDAAALSTMQIIDGTARLIRAPVARFRSSDIGVAAFGYNFVNSSLLGALLDAVVAEPNITLFPSTVENVALSPDGVTLSLSDGVTVEADFVIGADGRKSRMREAAGVGIRTWAYPQTAVVLNFAHTLPHNNTSTEFHTETGPFTQVPLPGNRSSLVWVVRPEEAERLLALSPEDLGERIETRMQSMLGKVTVEDGAQAWPLSSLVADRFGKGRVALIGEAAHAFPPIGAQGLNLSLRDIITLTEILGTVRERPVPADAGDRFDRRRRMDVLSRTYSVDLLNRSLLSEFLPVQMVRAAGLHLISGLAPLRNMLMREGVEPGRGLRALPQMLKDAVSRR
ncbi:UbiH/UbiF family hydroxylase [Allorhizobium borbori]|uniref:2-octaprenyl-6-methoxyphenol hydroxylase n=1 Tax=Allorhizobium borbori TaxID=485907 RepID=A0A7W6K1J3_9HYPH|nr:UbiH/UbiF family hydroxylase [Allorhizobium borbori]MBB4102362.1 2-octaprenyl-6-methoxyphenol hydroxylase [Allorhizobium borbori]